MIEVNKYVKRWCRHCRISNKEVRFFSGVLKNKSGRKRYYFNICMPCKIEQRRIQKRKYYLRNRLKEIAAAAKWNRENRARIRVMARLRTKRRAMARVAAQPAFAF